MGYSRKRIRGIHRLYDQEIDWEVSIGDKKRFVIDTIPYGSSLADETIQFVAKYCYENEYPFGIITNGDDFAIVSGCLDDEQPILRQKAIQDPEEAIKILELYNYKNYDSSKIKEYYMQFQFTLEKLKDRLSSPEVRQAIYEKTEELVDCKPSKRNKDIIKQFIDSSFDNKRSSNEQTNQNIDIEKEEDELIKKVDELQKQLADAQSKMDIESTKRSEMQSEIDEKAKKIAIYEEQIKKLSTQLETKQADTNGDNRQVNVQAGLISVETTEDVESLMNKLASVQVEVNQLKEQIDSNKKVIVSLQEEKSDIVRAKEELQKEVEILRAKNGLTSCENSNTSDNSALNDEISEVVELRDSLKKTEEQLEEANNRISLLKIEIDSIRKSHNIQADEVQLEVGGNNERLIKSLVTENSQLKTQIKLMIDSDSLTGQADAFAVEVGKYRDKIQSLVNKNTKLTQQIEQQRIQIEDLYEKLASKGQAKQVAAQELLDSIADDEEQERTYVAVIDDSLFQERDIKKFVGICIEELYKTAAVTLMPMLYDSQNFVLKEAKDSESCDFTLGTKRFVLDIEQDTEDSLISKVIQMYSKYNDRIFLCKKIGTAKADFDDLYKQKKVEDTIQMEIENETQKIHIDLRKPTDIENIALDEQARLDIKDGQVIGYGYFGIRGQEDLINYEYAESKGIKFLYNAYNSRYYQIDDDQLEQQLVGCIQALIAVCPINLEQAMTKYHDPETFKDFKNLLQPVQAYNKTKMRLPNHRLVIERLDQMLDVIKILQTVADIFGYSEEQITLVHKMVYFQDDQNILGCLADIDSIQCPQNIEYTGDVTGEFFEKGIDGGILDNTTLSRNQLEVQNKLFKGLTRVITNDIDQEIVDEQQFQNAMSLILNKAIANKKTINPKQIGLIVGSNKLILSTNKQDVYDKFVEVKAGSMIYYVQRLQPVQQMYAFIRIQQVLFGNRQIRFIMNISKDAFDFYKNDFITSNPSLDMVVGTIIKYIETRI